MPATALAVPQRTARKLNRRHAVQQAKRGMSNPDIAKSQGVATSTVFRFMERVKPERKALEEFKTQRADVLARLQAKSLEVQERLIDRLDDRVVNALKASQIPGLMLALNAQHGTSFDKERLERGESTSNLSLVSKMIDSRVTGLYKPKAIEKPTKQKRPAPPPVDITPVVAKRGVQPVDVLDSQTPELGV